SNVPSLMGLACFFLSTRHFRAGLSRAAASRLAAVRATFADSIEPRRRHHSGPIRAKIECMNPLPSLDEIREAQKLIYELMQPTPQISWPLLNQRLKAQVWVKHENHTPIGAFKARTAIV